MNTQKQILLIVVLFFTFVGGCAAYAAIDLPIRSQRQSDFFRAESIDRGALLFANNCRTCHGIKGQGGVGLPLNKPQFQDQDPLILKANQDLIRRTLYCGRAGTLMPAWLNTNGGSLNARQIDHLVDLITAPPSNKYLDEDGQPTSKGWLSAVEFAHNLNRETSAVVGGDSLDSIAKDHGVGYEETARLNGNIAIDQPLKEGSTLQLPSGRTHRVAKSNETIVKVVEAEHVGAILLAEANKLAYAVDSRGNFTLLGPDGKPVTGLFPGTTLALPAGATYVVRSGDTPQSIADRHGLSVSSIVGLNGPALSGLAATDPIDFERKLVLPSGTSVIVRAGQTLAVLATQHGLKPADLAAANNIAVDKVLAAGDRLTLPANTKYTVQTGDTLAAVAADHGIAATALASANNLQPGESISPQVVLKLPPVDKYVVNGQSLDDIARTYSNVTADSLGAANGVPANAILRIAQQLKLPPDTWGGAPPDTKNPGTACVQHAVPDSVFKTLPGVGTPVAPATPPANVSNTAAVTLNATDFTVVADGTPQEPNKGVVLLKKGTAVEFTDKAGLHTITINGKKEKPTINVGETYRFTFADAGTYRITCDFHPEMLANVFTQ